MRKMENKILENEKKILQELFDLNELKNEMYELEEMKKREYDAIQRK